MSSGFLSAAYRRPNPPEGQVHHRLVIQTPSTLVVEPILWDRYVFLLFAQPMLFLPPVFPAQMAGSRLHFNLDAFVFDFGLGAPVGGNFLKSYFTNVEVKEEETVQRTKPSYTIKAATSPFMAGVIGSVMGLLYAASN